MVGFRLALYHWSQESRTDFDLLYISATYVTHGINPYTAPTDWYPLFYPLPAVLLAVPFTLIPLDWARPAFDIMVGSVFAYALSKRGATLALLSGAYLYAMREGQTTPLMVGASLIPALGFLLTVKPNTALPLWLARPNRQAIVGAWWLLLASLAILPSWPLDWLHALGQMNGHLRPPILRPFGFLLLLAAFRWRTPEGRLLLALAVIPQNSLPHELVPLALIPGNLVEMGVYVVGTWITVAVAASVQAHRLGLAETVAQVWPATLIAGYLPMLTLLLLRPVGQSRRQPAPVPPSAVCPPR